MIGLSWNNEALLAIVGSYVGRVSNERKLRNRLGLSSLGDPVLSILADHAVSLVGHKTEPFPWRRWALFVMIVMACATTFNTMTVRWVATILTKLK